MKRFALIFSPESSDDLEELRTFIKVRASQQVANRYISKIVREALTLVIAPYRGESRSDLRTGLRTIGFKGAVTIVFSIEAARERVEITSVLYRGRRPADAYRYVKENDQFHEL